MKYILDEDICANNDLTVKELLVLMLFKYGVTLDNIHSVYNLLLAKEALVHEENEYYITQAFDDKLCKILLTAEPDMPSEDKLDVLAKELMEVFPLGKKPGTNNYWRCNKKDIKLRLQKFFKLYGMTYTFDQIISAAKDYVESFNGNYAYMRILKYFIWKDERKIGADGKGYIEEVSDLASHIENAGTDNVVNTNWTNELK